MTEKEAREENGLFTISVKRKILFRDRAEKRNPDQRRGLHCEVCKKLSGGNDVQSCFGIFRVDVYKRQ